MQESYLSSDLSDFADNDHHQLAPIRHDLSLQKNPIFNHKDAQRSVRPTRSINRALPVLTPNRATGMLEFSEEFQDYLAIDEANSNLNMVVFVGSKQVGKSFLIDFLISKQEQFASRCMSKIAKPYVSAPSLQVKGKNGEKIIYLDIDGEVTNEVFLWTYFLSSTVILNLNAGDKKAEDQFISRLENTKINLKFESEDLSLPHLIVLYRDNSKKEFFNKEFQARVEGYGLFSEITTVSMAHPATSTITSKDIRDVAESLLSQSFINDALNLSWIIKSCKPKTIKGNFLGSKIAGLTLEPLTRCLNRQGKVLTSKIWGDVIQTLSVGYYNYFIKKYSDELQRQFADEQPCDKYTLYKRLSRVRRNIEKKVEGFNSIAGDPTFEKYRQKLMEKIASKEKIIREINKQKSIKKNEQLGNKLFSDMNDNNCRERIQLFCQSNLDDGKTEILVDYMDSVIKKRVAELEKSKNPAIKPTTQVQKLENELRQLDERIEAEKKANNEVIENDFNKIKASIRQKEQEVADIQAEMEKQKKAAQEKKASQSKQIQQLESKIEQLKEQTSNQQQEIAKLRSARQARVKEEIQKLDKRIKQDEDRFHRLQEQVNRAQQASALTSKPAKASKDACCLVM